MRPLYRTLIFAAIAWAVALPGERAVAQTSIREHDQIGWAETEFYKDAEWERSSRAAPKDLQWWQDAKFGLLIQWGPSTLTGEEISWSRGARGGKDGGAGDIPVEVYDNLYKRFNPVKFNADDWVRAAQQAGQRYIVFQAKHHDGFCLWNTKTTAYNIMNTPFHRDVLAELAEACRKANMPLGIYFSQRDWYHPDYFGPHHDRFITFMHQQIRELLTNYGPIRILWFDAWYPGVYRAEHWKSQELFEGARWLQPGIIINNRSGLPGDFDTPEQHVGEFQINRPWETVMSLGQQWAWKPNDELKSTKESVDVLVRCAVGGGNWLLGLGPMPDGRIEPRQVARVAEIGQWLKKYGETIYGTRGGPFISAEWGGATCRGNKIYLHLLRWSGVREKGGGREAWSIDKLLRLPPLAQKIAASKVLSGGKATVTQTDDGIEIQVHKEFRDPIDTIIELTLDEPVVGS